MVNIDDAILIAAKAHAGQLDRDGNPVILHPLTVGLMGHTDEERVAGFLHDVVEDTDMTFEDLEEQGIPEGIISALKLLTHDKTLSYDEYLQRIIDSHNPIALQVKFNDLQHNFERGKDHPDLQAKHGPALEKIKAAVEAESQVTLFKYEAEPGHELALFACGCFWGAQHQFQRKAGVLKSTVGYTGGEEQFPTYAQVRDHQTHHVEAVMVEYDPQQVTYTDLCKLFFEIHDPAQVDGVGPDIGPQYRSEIFYLSETQRQEAMAVADILRAKGDEVNTLLRPAGDFWVGEAYHQDYYDKTGGSPYCHIRIKKF